MIIKICLRATCLILTNNKIKLICQLTSKQAFGLVCLGTTTVTSVSQAVLNNQTVLTQKNDRIGRLRKQLATTHTINTFLVRRRPLAAVVIITRANEEVRQQRQILCSSIVGVVDGSNRYKQSMG